eukprot:gnl/TRDRNA2_/TRDRNA2_165494_c3_seq3.p1 gnl/TRDRNA2_/TRDRNA2_165494_c3~~gnl/TRDRNA2_/TRDRNA2_165494_c3_seq3.p1  ORF type:complete len:393 (+),score=52.84 gnl/TRDRNA2_/TRDRNA2_165494_c3_seq3:155-1180(+)
MPGNEELMEAMDGLLEGLKGSDIVAERLQHVDFANAAMFSIYPGGGSRYVKHVDNVWGTDGRRLTAIIYLNRNWEPEHGGQLRIFEPTIQSMGVKADVLPLWNRLVLFWPNTEVPHEVLSVYKDRAAVSIWYLCGRESLGNQEGLRSLFDHSEVRSMAGKQRREAILRAARTEAQRQALRSVPVGDDVVAAEFLRKYTLKLSSVFEWPSEQENKVELDGGHRKRMRASSSEDAENDRSLEHLIDPNEASSETYAKHGLWTIVGNEQKQNLSEVSSLVARSISSCEALSMLCARQLCDDQNTAHAVVPAICIMSFFVGIASLSSKKICQPNRGDNHLRAQSV